MGICFSIISLLFPFTANALSATTANMIAGTEPYLVLLDGPVDEHGNPTQGSKLANLNQLLGFTMPDGSGGKVQINSSQAGTAITAPKKMKYQDVVTLIQANNTDTTIPVAMQKDDDGDLGTPEGTMKATWYNGSIAPANVVTNLNQTFSSCGGPYYLVISTNAVKAKTTYGYPDREKIYSTGIDSATYRFTGQDQGICYIQPASMAVISGTVYATAANSKYPYQSATNPGGYNPDKWQLGALSGGLPTTQTGGGFKRNAGFPTTAFKGAKFSLIGSENTQSNFRCNSTSSDITLSTENGAGTNCTVTYKTSLTAKPTSDIVINMEYNNGTNWTQADSYTIKASQIKLWARVVRSAAANGFSQYKTDQNLTTNGTFPAANLCAGSNLGIISSSTAESYFFERNEFTNSPIVDIPLPTTTMGGFFARDVDGTFQGEWGHLWRTGNTSPYTGSDFEVGSMLWTRGMGSSAGQWSQFSVGTDLGFLYIVNPTSSLLTVCR